MIKRTLKAVSLALGLCVASGANAFVFNGSQYTIVDAERNPNNYSWTEARNDAVSRGGHLATFGSSAEWNAVVAGLGLDGSPQYWLGGYQDRNSPNPTSNWNWVDGTTWDFTAWAPGEPNDWWYPGEQNQENYLMTWGNGSVWNDSGSGSDRWTRQGYILETAAVPEPTTLALLGLGLAGLGLSRKRQEKA